MATQSPMYKAQKLIENAYRFQIRYKDEVVTSFTMSLPPVEKSYMESFRTNVIKTAGGAVVLDYGEDNKTIMLSGLIMRNIPFYIDSRDRKYFTNADSANGIAVFKHFKEQIMRCRSYLETLPKYQGKEIDLSELEILFYDFFDDEYWYVNIDNFSWQESSAQPLWVRFTINMTTLQPLKDNGKTPAKRIVSPQSLLQQVKNAVNNIRRAVNQIRNAVKGFINNVYQFMRDIERIIDSVDKLLSELTDLITMPLQLMTNILNLVNRVITKLITLPFRIAGQFVRSFRNLENAVSNLKNNPFYNSERLSEIVTGSGISRSRINKALARSTAGQATAAYGLSVQVMAKSAYGDASLFPLLMVENRLINANVNIGEIVYIPNDDPTAQDVYGIDISFDDNGIKATASGDIKTIGGVQNVIETIQRRIKILQGSYYRFDELGVENVIGTFTSELSKKIVRINILEAIGQDPRVENVTEVEFFNDDDKYKLSAKIKLVNNPNPIILKLK